MRRSFMHNSTPVPSSKTQSKLLREFNSRGNWHRNPGRRHHDRISTAHAKALERARRNEPQKKRLRKLEETWYKLEAVHYWESWQAFYDHDKDRLLQRLVRP